MDLFTIPYTQLRRTQRKNDIRFWDLQITGKSTPVSNLRKNVITFSPRHRHPTLVDKKYQDKAIGCDLFENIFINQTFTCKSNNASFDSNQDKLFIPEMKVLKKRKHGAIAFQQIPRLVTPNRMPERQAEMRITSYVTKKRPKTRRILDLEILQQTSKRDNFFAERKIYFNDLICSPCEY